jgi:hypothetical protein
MRFAKLVPVVMEIARADSKSEYAYKEALQRAIELTVLIETIPPIVTTTTTATDEVVVEEADGNVGMVSLLKPPMSQTKGRGKNKGKAVNAEIVVGRSTSTYKRRRTESGQEIISVRTCGYCGLKGHCVNMCGQPEECWLSDRLLLRWFQIKCCTVSPIFCQYVAK